MEAKETGNEYTSKKIEELRKKQSRYAKEAEGADHPNVKTYYQIEANLAGYDLEDAITSEAKRQARKALRHIEKKTAEIEELRKQVTAVLYDNEILSYSARIEFEDELGKRFENYSELLYGRSY